MHGTGEDCSSGYWTVFLGNPLLRLLDLFFYFSCPFCIELLFIWSQLVEESEELSNVNAFFIGDVLEDRDGKLVVG